ncbi:hypothetical protein D6_0195 [Aeromonas phage D6]|uniref:Uncharacterized protein n=1 Tax=Aeromonas phage D6 TaxID=2593322 RepID=A0A514TWH2_9CAUD|nr:hypothetical protein PQC08_gp080 [Aeromonas phage D6]QDJ97354.1 hypothetical protein D6_0195 [Aeromonas phage D6]
MNAYLKTCINDVKFSMLLKRRLTWHWIMINIVIPVRCYFRAREIVYVDMGVWFTYKGVTMCPVEWKLQPKWFPWPLGPSHKGYRVHGYNKPFELTSEVEVMLYCEQLAYHNSRLLKSANTLTKKLDEMVANMEKQLLEG